MAEGQRERKTSTMPALLIPADPTKPVSIVDLWDKDGRDGETDRLRELVGGPVDVRATELGDVWLNDEGRDGETELNARLTWWTLNLSREAREGELEGVEAYWAIFGDVVLTGDPDVVGDITPVRQEAIDLFRGLTVHPQALADWTDPAVPPIVIVDWPDEGPEL